MFENDNKTVGFNATDADALGRMIETREGEYIEGKVRAKPNGIRLYRFTLNANMSGGSADADILEMDGTDTTIDADVEDPVNIFSTLESGDPGLCILQGGVYYIIQAPCPT